MAKVDFFGSAQTFAKPKKPKATKDRVAVDGLDEYAALDAVEKVVKSLKEGVKIALEEQAKQFFLEEAEKTGKRPESFRGVDEKSEASVELRKRSTTSALDDASVDLLAEFNIPVETVADQVETFIINPEYANDTKLLEKVSKALAKVPGLPVDFIQKQTATTKRVVTDDTLTALFKQPRVVMERLLSLVTTFAVKPTTTESPQDAIKRVLKLIEDEVPNPSARENLKRALVESASA